MVRKPLCRSLAVLAFAVSARSSGEVLDVSPNGFAVRNTVTVPGDPARAYAAVVAVGKWWDPDHTYSGDAANLSIDPKP
jgi:hypothetical protein